MSNRLLRNIAATIGAGLAVGINRTLAPRQPRRPTSNPTFFLSRLEEIEGRVLRVELAPKVLAPPPEEIAALGALVSSQSEEIAGLHREIQRIEQRNAEQAEAFAQKMALVEQHVPMTVEANVSARIADLEQRLRGEFKEVHDRTVEAFVETIEKRVVGRIATIENSLSLQSQTIGSLHEKSLKTDEHLNRLLEAVDKLCVRAEIQSQVPVHPEDRAESTSDGPAAVPAAAAQEMSSPAPPPVQSAAAAASQESFAAHFQRAMEVENPPGPGFRPAARSNGYFVSKPIPQTGRDLRAMGMAILGLVVFGFRLIR